MYRAVWTLEAIKGLKRVDRKTAEKLKEKIDTYLTRDPHNLGKPLVADFSGQYRYRFGNYRVVYEIKQKEVLILIIKVGHRREVYE